MYYLTSLYYNIIINLIKTIDIPNAENIDNAGTMTNYQINMETFLSGVTYSTNKVTFKKRIDVAVEIVEINFNDYTDWLDTMNSSYLVYENDEIKVDSSVKKLEKMSF